mgnify:CR=1 FL=1
MVCWLYCSVSAWRDGRQLLYDKIRRIKEIKSWSGHNNIREYPEKAQGATPKYSLLSLCHSTPIFHLSTNTILYINLIYIHLSIVHFSFIYSFHLLFLYSVNLSQYDICTPLRSTMSHCLAKYVTRRRQGAGESRKLGRNSPSARIEETKAIEDGLRDEVEYV